MTKNIGFSRLASRLLFGTGVALVAFAVMAGPSVASAALLYRQLEVGSTGSDVSSLQTFLASDPSIYPQGLVTGYFGFLTKAAVSNFQSANGIANVGRVGPITMAAINAQMNGGAGTGQAGIAPTIGQLSVSTTNSSATISWMTNEPAAAIVYYSTSAISIQEASAAMGVTVSGTSELVHVGLQTSHTATLNNLQPNTTYNYVVYVRDGSGNESILLPKTFRTN